jgi:hypothetical protein
MSILGPMSIKETKKALQNKVLPSPWNFLDLQTEYF